MDGNEVKNGEVFKQKCVARFDIVAYYLKIISKTKKQPILLPGWSVPETDSVLPIIIIRAGFIMIPIMDHVPILLTIIRRFRTASTIVRANHSVASVTRVDAIQTVRRTINFKHRHLLSI